MTLGTKGERDGGGRAPRIDTLSRSTAMPATAPLTAAASTATTSSLASARTSSLPSHSLSLDISLLFTL